MSDSVRHSAYDSEALSAIKEAYQAARKNLEWLPSKKLNRSICAVGSCTIVEAILVGAITGKECSEMKWSKRNPRHIILPVS